MTDIEPEDLGDDTGGNPTGEILELHEILEWDSTVMMQEMEDQDG